MLHSYGLVHLYGASCTSEERRFWGSGMARTLDFSAYGIPHNLVAWGKLCRTLSAGYGVPGMLELETEMVQQHLRARL